MKKLKDLPVTLKRSRRARRLALRLDAKERTVNLVVPDFMSEKKAYMFALDHEEWIVEQLNQLPNPIYFNHGQIIPILGQNYRIIVDYDEDRKRTDIFFNENQIVVQTNKEDPGNRLTRFLKKLAKEKLSELSFKKAEHINKKIRSISIRDTKSRWGSCSEDGCLSYSWRLIFAPYEAMDYVVAHEVAHLIHLNHSREFWDLCEELSENYKSGKSWMKKNASELMRYG